MCASRARGPETLDHDAYLAAMRENVARSRHHIVAQARIIADLAGHGPSEYLDTARDLMVTMQGHLAAEEDILARLEGTTR